MLPSAVDDDGNFVREIINGWEAIRPVLRTAVEAKLQGMSSQYDAAGCLLHVCDLLRESAPRRTTKTAYTIGFGVRIAWIWHLLGLRVGTAYDGYNGKSFDSLFQRYCAAALRAVGDDHSKISRNMAMALKEHLRFGRPPEHLQRSLRAVSRAEAKAG